jgi:hypothetical protein
MVIQATDVAFGILATIIDKDSVHGGWLSGVTNTVIFIIRRV